MRFPWFGLVPLLIAGVIANSSVSAVAAPLPPAAATPPTAPPVVGYPVHMDVSPALRTLPGDEEEGRKASNRGRERGSKHLDTGHRSGARSPAPGSPRAPAVAAPALLNSFEGVGNGFSGPSGTFFVNAAPPDPNGAVGPNHYVETVNTDLAVFDKSGTALYGPVPINTVWSGFGGGCQTNNDGDPSVVYDVVSDRWVIDQFSVSTTPYLNCVAVSTSPDPTGTYNRYSYQYSAFPDYPKLGVWPDGYYLSFNMFTGGTTFAGAKACSYDRTRMLTGQVAAQICFDTSTTYGGLLPSTLDGARQPPAGAPNYFVALGATTSTLAYWKFHSDWTAPANSTFTGPTALTVAAYAEACGGGTCIPQSGTTQKLDSLADRLMYRLAYRNLGDHEALVVNHSVTAGSSVGIRWYELRVSGGNLTVFQQGTYAPDASYRWMGSIAMDQSGNIGLGFSLSSASLHPSVHYSGRLAGDAAGTMAQGEGTIIDAAGSQTANLSRWGDYTSLAIDPADDCTFWYTNEYLPSNGTFNWHTRIGTFKLTGCAPPAANDFSISASPSSLSIQQGLSGTSTISTTLVRGTAETVTFSASGLPTNATASFSPSSATVGTSSTLTLTTASTTPAGSYTVTVTGMAPSATHATPVALTVTTPPPPPGSDPIVNGGFESGNFSGWTSTGVTAVSAAAAHSGVYGAQVGSASPGGDSTIAQTFTVPSAGGTLSFWYKVVCTDSVTYDWATASLKDNVTGGTTTLLAKTCTNTGSWLQSSTSLSAGSFGAHSVTLTLLDHDDNYPGDPTYTYYDEVKVASTAPPPPDFSLSVSPTSQTVVHGSPAGYTVTITPTGGFSGSVTLSASGLPTDAGATFNPNPATSTSAMNVTTATTTPAGTYGLTITGMSGSLTRTTPATLVVTAPDFSLAVSPASQTVTQGQTSGAYTVTVTRVNGFADAVSFSVSGQGAGATPTFNPPSTSANSTSLTFSTSTTATTGSFALTITGNGGGLTRTTPATLVVNPPDPIVNGGFETASFSGWTATGVTAVATGAAAHSGIYGARVGSTSPDGDSSIAQTFTVPPRGGTLSFWYKVVCTDSVTYDWAIVTLRDNVTGVTTTLVPKTCTNTGAWVQYSTSLSASSYGGHGVTLTLADHDDNWPGDPTYTNFDDVKFTPL